MKLLSYQLFNLYFLFNKRSISFNKGSVETRKILVCRKQFYGKNKNLVASDYFYIDKYFEEKEYDFAFYLWDKERVGIFSDLIFLRKILIFKPSVIVMISYNSSAIGSPSIKAVKKIRDALNLNIISIWADTGKSFLRDNIHYFDKDIFSKHICWDNPILDLDFESISEDEARKFIPYTYTPESEKIFHPDSYKDLDVVFMGQISSYRDYRKEFIDLALEQLVSFKTYFSGADRVNQIDHDAYASIMNRSKIGLNFSYGANSHQLKGRSIHTMLSGALLLETKNPQIEALFEDGKHFISFKSKEDMIKKIKYYLNNPKEREMIASKGRQKVLSDYSRDNFWKISLNEKS